MKKFEWALLLGFILSVCLGSVTTFAEDCAEVRSNVLRLHIMASSDSREAQTLKLQIRDAVLAQAGELFLQPDNLEEAKALTEENLDAIKSIAQAELARQGSGDNVEVELLNMYFTTRQYEQFTMPAGMYDAIRITIGEGVGKNWWCVMYPPMCIPTADGGEITQVEQTIYELGASSLYEPRFAIVEAIESLKQKLAAL